MLLVYGDWRFWWFIPSSYGICSFHRWSWKTNLRAFAITGDPGLPAYTCMCFHWISTCHLAVAEAFSCWHWNYITWISKQNIHLHILIHQGQCADKNLCMPFLWKASSWHIYIKISVDCMHKLNSFCFLCPKTKNKGKIMHENYQESDVLCTIMEWILLQWSSQVIPHWKRFPKFLCKTIKILWVARQRFVRPWYYMSNIGWRVQLVKPIWFSASARPDQSFQCCTRFFGAPWGK